MKHFFVAERYTSHNAAESKEKTSTNTISFETPVIFSSQGSKQYKPIT